MLTFDNYSGLLKFEILQQYPNVMNFVTTRQHPNGLGDDFNIGYSGGEYDDIQKNRNELALSLGLSGKQFVFQNQVHGNNYKIVNYEDSGAGFNDKNSAIECCDILITDKKGICIVTRSADCIPVLLYAPDKNVIAAIHSGREGTFLGAAAKAVSVIVKNYHADPSKIVACIGPGIEQNCYEVDYDCAYKFLQNQRFKSYTISKTETKYYLNLKKMIFEDLISEGLVVNNIEICDICTKCNNQQFFSARKGDKQRFCAGICLM